MPRPSPQTSRVMAIITLLSDRSDAGATLSEIADTLGHSRASLVHVLATMAAEGFVVRRPSDRRYHLGPALVAPGRVAADRFPALADTRDAIVALSRDMGYAVLAFRRDVDHARLVEAAWDPDLPAPAVRIGDLLPIEPPLGAVFTAWAGDDDIAAWLDAGPRQPAARDALARSLASSRRRGYVVELRPPPRLQRELTRIVGRGQQMRRAEGVQSATADIGSYIADTVTDGELYDVSTISVPVVGDGGTVSLAINLVGFTEAVTGRVARALGGRARAAADELAARLACGGPSRAPLDSAPCATPSTDRR